MELNQQNFFAPGNIGDVAEPAFTGRAGSFVCGATLRISLSVDEYRRITDARFKSVGCSVLVVAASTLTEEIKGKTTGEAAALVQSLQGNRIEEWGQLTKGKEHCPLLACEALVAAIASYSDAVRDDWAGDEALICTCFGVSEQRIEAEIRQAGLRTVAEVTRACNAGAGCGSCWPLIEDILVTSDE